MARTTIDLETLPNCTHANRAQPISALASLATNKTNYPEAWSYVNLVLNPGGGLAANETYFNALKVVSAAALQGSWEGNGAGFTPGVTNTSRNTILLPRGGPYLVNHSIPISAGGVIGKGTNISSTNGNDTSYLEYDHAGWLEPGAQRAVMKSVNWGTSAYLESAYVDGFRINGAAGQWRDPSYQQYGVLMDMMGETANFATGRGVYVHDCNNHGIWIEGVGPGRIGDISVFDNNQGGLKIGNTNSLGNLTIDRVSADNNGFAYINDQAGGWVMNTLKCETGLSNARGKVFKAQVPVWTKGWIAGEIKLLSSAVAPNTARIDALVHWWNTANNCKLEIGTITGWQAVNLVMNHRNNKRYYFSGTGSGSGGGDYAAIGVTMRGYGTAFSIKAHNPQTTDIDKIAPGTGTFVEAVFNSPGDRLHPVTDPAQYLFTATPASPLWDDTGGATPPPPPTPVVTTVTVSLATDPVTSGGTSQASAQVFDQFGQVMTGQTIGWSIVSGPATINGSGLVTTSGSGSVVVRATVLAVTDDATLTVQNTVPPPTPPSGQIPAIVVVNANDATSAAMATAYCTAWGIPDANKLIVNLGSTEATTDTASLATARNAIRAAASARGAQVAILAFRFPTQYVPSGSGVNPIDHTQAITDCLELGVHPVQNLRLSPFYNYLGSLPYTDKGEVQCVQLLSSGNIKRTAHGTKPVGEIYVLCAKDSNSVGNYRGTARYAGSSGIAGRSDVTRFDNRNDARVGSGNNPFNNLSTELFTLKNKVPAPACCPNPGPAQPVLAYFGSMYQLTDKLDLTYQNGWGAEHLTSFGGFLPGSTQGGFEFMNARGQTSIEFFLNRTVGASWAGGCVSEPGGSLAALPEQFILPDIFIPLWKPSAAAGSGGGKANILCMSASVKHPGRYLKAGDGLCAPFQ